MSDNEDCRNDCLASPVFPRRPGTVAAAGHDEDCFCCRGERKISRDNRPGLARFNYRIGSYASIREFLLRRIDAAPSLRNWTHREADDPAIALLEGAAILGDVLAFYQETYANEAFLRTARWRESVSDLVRLLGYRLSPALGGRATFVFEIKKDEPVSIPAGFPVRASLEDAETPAEFEIVEAITAYPWLSRFHLFRPLTTPRIGAGTKEFYVSAPADVVIKAGDRLLVGAEAERGAGGPTDLRDAEIVTVEAVRELHGRRLFSFKGSLKKRGLKSAAQLAAFKLGRTFHHFGYNAPPTCTRLVNPARPADGVEEIDISFHRFLDRRTGKFRRGADGKGPLDALGGVGAAASREIFSRIQLLRRTLPGGSDDVAVDWEQIDTAEQPVDEVLVVAPPLEADEFPLDAEAEDLSAGALFAVGLDAGATTLLRRVVSARELSMTWGQMTAGASLLKLESFVNLIDGKTQADIRGMFFHEVLGEPFTVKAAPVEFSPAPPNRVLAFYGTEREAAALAGRRLMFGEAARVVTAKRVFAPDADWPRMHFVELSEAIDARDFPQENPRVTIYGNLADADQGRRQPEAILGGGDRTLVFQTFMLPKTPLTYHLVAASSPPIEPALDVYVGGRLWQRVESFYGRGADEEIYLVREDEEHTSWVQFGDGKTGARLPTGVDNVTAVFRTGAGAFGRLKDGAKVEAEATLKNLDRIEMPGIATGGSAAETDAAARRAAPGRIQSLDRLVALKDFETETAAMPGVTLARAAWELVENIPTVVVTALMETGRGAEIASIEAALNASNVGRGAARFPVRIVAGRREFVYVAAEYALGEKFRADLVEAEIRRALGVNFGKAGGAGDESGLFGLRRRTFGRREYGSTIEGTIQMVAGVVWARVTGFWSLGAADDPEDLAAAAKESVRVVRCGPHRVLGLSDKHLFLTRAGV